MASTKPAVKATEQRIEVSWPPNVSPTDVQATVVPPPGKRSSRLETLGWNRQPPHNGTVTWKRPKGAKPVAMAGQKVTVEIKWKQNGKAEIDKQIVAVQEYDPADETSSTSSDEIANLLKVPLRVQVGPGLRGADVESIENWREGIVDAIFPRLPHRADASQFRESLAELMGGATTPSPYGGSPYGGSAYQAPTAQSGSAMLSAYGGAGASGPWTAGAYGGGSANGTATPLAMADLTGPFAPLASIANALEMDAVPAARDIGALSQNADLDLIEAHRAVVLETLTSLIAELRAPGPDGPEHLVLLDLTVRLGSSVGALGSATQTGPTPSVTPVTPADFANVSRFQVLGGWATTVNGVVTTFPFGVGGDKRTIIAEVKQLLAIITEKARELEIELDAADFGPAQRARFDVFPASKGPSTPANDQISVARLLAWVQEQCGNHLPRLLDASGTLARGTVVSTLTQQGDFLSTLRDRADFPWDYPIVDRLLDELVRVSPSDPPGFLIEAITEAGNL